MIVHPQKLASFKCNSRLDCPWKTGWAASTGNQDCRSRERCNASAAHLMWSVQVVIYWAWASVSSNSNWRSFFDRDN
jgi:hypothetical protein